MKRCYINVQVRLPSLNTNKQQRFQQLTFAKSGGGLLPRDKFERHQTAFLVIDSLVVVLSNLQKESKTIRLTTRKTTKGKHRC